MMARCHVTRRDIDVHAVRRTFTGGRRALNGVSLQIREGEMVALIGASGSGKSTLLRNIAGLAVADPGEPSSITVGGRVMQRDGQLSGEARAIRSGIGFVFQQFNLVGRLPVMTNVMTGALHRMPIWRSLTGRFDLATRREAFAALDQVGIASHAWQRTSTLSGGQQQRATIARTLVQNAGVILADEPIASLDPESSRRVMEILGEINQTNGVTVVVSLHQVEFAVRYCARTVALASGEVVYDGPSGALTPARLRELYRNTGHASDGASQDEMGEAVVDVTRLPVHAANDAARRSVWPAVRAGHA